ncbi:MAG: hypothetical protein AB1646_08470 [Thermodesulfobacteriota bacterium]
MYSDYSDGVYFDLNNPKILIGLIIGGMIPYAIVATAALFTKRVLFATILKDWAKPTWSRLCLVAALEVISVTGAAAALHGSDVADPWKVWLIYQTGATWANLILVSPGSQEGRVRAELARRSLYALFLGLINVGYMITIMLVWGFFRS